MSANLGRRWHWSALAAALGCSGAALLYLAWDSGSQRDYDPSPKAFHGKSTALRQTVIVPTLDSPAPAGKSVVWCSSFQVAWIRLKTDVAHGPVRVRNAELVAERLNRTESSEANLTPADFYAAAGMAKKISRSVNAVRLKRSRLGIPTVNDRRRKRRP